ncbi:MAG TPA: CHAT domain-containing protein [Thermoanaerobaculia bacterium]|jgi:hypothetical protein|nr:CHAT domain-containing protein [Thermoanaerobaculia bacterium]
MEYEDFTVQLGPQMDSGIQVRAWRSSGGEATGKFRPVVRPDDLVSWFPSAVRAGIRQEDACRDLRRLATAKSCSLTAFDIGQAMFESLFSDEVRSLLDRSLGSIEQTDRRGLRIKLRLDLGDEGQAFLHSLPWELLCRPDTADFLSLSRLSPIVRYLDVPSAIHLQPLPGIFRILVLAPELTGLHPLDLERERANLEALQNEVNGLKVEFLKPANLSGLRRILLEENFQALHFMGHGNFDPRAGEGLIFLEGPGGAACPVSAGALATVLRDFRSIRLVVLNACSTGRAGSGSGINPFSGIAPALVRTGIPAVLAMQLPISDWAAIEFSEAFYRRLCAGDPVDTAVSEGRQAIHSRNPLSLEWAIPALFLRVPNGALFHTETAPLSLSSADQSLLGIDHLRAGNYDLAIADLRRSLAGSPKNGLPAVMLGVALSRGKHLSSLPYQVAVEMHRLFSASLSKPNGQSLAAAALIALKIDYFRRNSVREMPPSLEEAIAIADRASLTQQNSELLGLLNMSTRAQSAIASLNEQPKGARHD